MIVLVRHQCLMMNMLIFFLLTSQIINAFERMAVIYQMHDTKLQKLMCLSKDDGSALVWNAVLSEELLKKSYIMRFYNDDKVKLDENKIDCTMTEGDKCLYSWFTINWKFTDSILTPLGPVFDRRWEELYLKFPEFVKDGSFVHKRIQPLTQLNLSLNNVTTFAISIRNGFDDISILICNSSTSLQRNCYRIVINSSNNPSSTIQKCSLRFESRFERYDFNKNCNTTGVIFKHSPLSSIKWRTFLIKWDSATQTIFVYDGDDNTISLKYHDKQERIIYNTTSYYISGAPMFFRLHIYNFLHTTVANATLTSPIFQFNNGTICIQLFIGLCAECDINIMLFDAKHSRELKNLTVKGSSKIATHGLPTWQFVTIEHSIDRNSAIMELRPVLNSYSPNPLWAVANVRQCPRSGSFKKGIIYTAAQNVTCQKLFYDDHEVINISPDTKANINLDIPECPEDRIGPNCEEICKYNLECKATLICYKEGCTCPANYMGPYCTINISKPQTPTIVFLNTTNIGVRVPMIWKDTYEGSLSYSFIIKNKDGINNNETWKHIFLNMTELVEHFKNLDSDTTYHIACALRFCDQYTASCNIMQSKWLIAKTDRTLPLEVSSIKIVSISDTNVTLTWTATNLPRETILRYNVILRIYKYLGCKNSSTLNNIYTKQWTNSTSIVIKNLRPYTIYNVDVLDYNSNNIKIFAKTTFETKTSDIATETFSHMKIQGWNMKWNPPEDCTTIMGPLYTRIEIRGISDIVKDFYKVIHTAHYYLSLKKISLYGGERYVAKFYVVRHMRDSTISSAYQAYGFETPSGVPPRVTNLEVCEIDNRQTPPLVHLRWQRPLPPLNGTLHFYRIRSCKATKCNSTDIQLNTMCNMWDNYICGSIQTYYNNHTIEVVAYNVDVSEPGVPLKVPKIMIDNAIPDKPRDFNVTILNNSVVNLEWHHPWKTGNHLKYFYIQIYVISTNFQTSHEEDELLRNHGMPTNIQFPVTNYMYYYSKRLYLFPSTLYIVSIQAVTYTNKFSEPVYKEFKTPSTLEFGNQLKYMLEFACKILLNIPPVVNNTKDSTMHILVKGSQDHKLCKEYLKVPEKLRMQAGLDVNDIAWQAARLPTQELAGKLFTVGNNLFYGRAKNCPLLPDELYEITVIIIERNQNVHSKPIMLKVSIRNGTVSSTHYKYWFVFIILIFVLVPGAAFLFCQRKSKKKKKSYDKAQTMIDLNEFIYEEVQMPK